MGAGMDWIGITVLYVHIHRYPICCVCVCVCIPYMDGLPFTKSFQVRRATESCRTRDEASKRREERDP